VAALSAVTGIALGATTSSSQAPPTPPVIGAPMDCTSNAFCALGLRQVYGIDVTKQLTPLAPGDATYDALRAGTVSLAVGFSTDPQLNASDLVQLQDDRAMTGADNLVPVVTERIAETYGNALGAQLDRISAKLSLDELRALNTDAAGGDALDTVAERWVQAQGLAARSAKRKPGPALPLWHRRSRRAS